MSATIIVNSEGQRNKALRWLNEAEIDRGFTVTFRRNRRTTPQNARMWAMLTDVSEQLSWHGIKYQPEDWKLIFMDALGHELRMCPNIQGTGMVNLGRSSSKLSKGEMSDLMEVIAAFGARHGVTFKDDPEREVNEIMNGRQRA